MSLLLTSMLSIPESGRVAGANLQTSTCGVDSPQALVQYTGSMHHFRKASAKGGGTITARSAKRSPSHAYNPSLHVHSKQSMLTLCTVNCRTPFPFRLTLSPGSTSYSEGMLSAQLASRSRSIAHILVRCAYRGSAPHLADLFYLRKGRRTGPGVPSGRQR